MQRSAFLLVLLFTLSACRASQSAPEMPPLPPLVQVTVAADDIDSAGAIVPVTATPTDVPPATPAPASAGQWGVAYPIGLPLDIVKWVGANTQFGQAVPGTTPDVTIAIGADGQPLGEWIYAVAAAFPTIADDVESVTIRELWQSATTSDSAESLLVDPETAAVFTNLWGTPSAAVKISAADTISEQLWQTPTARAVVPFDKLTSDLKVLQLDGMSPLFSGLDTTRYALTVPITASGNGEAVASLQNALPFVTNRDEAKLTHVAMTGVTALVRATASNMEIYGITWPGEEVAALLNSADIAHISNEVSFDAACPYPNPIGGTSFCSDDRYLELLEYVGTDVVELTGNHLNDYGLENVGRSMDMYAELGWQTFGGGRDLAEAREPLIIEHNGNSIAFVGCNSFGPVYAWAGENLAGSNPCDGTMDEQIAQLSAENDIVIATLQYSEFYHYAPTAQQIVDFRALAEAGADAVSGSQGHHAQGFDFHNGAFIDYGLGNLFFDQMDMLGTRQAFIDNYIIYDGELISVDLYVGLIEDYARPRKMTPEERAQALQAVFDASAWE